MAFMEEVQSFMTLVISTFFSFVTALYLILAVFNR